MLGKAAVLGALLVALYDGNSWNVFYLFIAIGLAQFLVKFAAHRRKWSTLVNTSETSRVDRSLVHRTRFSGVTSDGSGKTWEDGRQQLIYLCSRLARTIVVKGYFCTQSVFAFNGSLDLFPVRSPMCVIYGDCVPLISNSRRRGSGKGFAYRQPAKASINIRLYAPPNRKDESSHGERGLLA
jgi:hypothetical protein